MQFDRRVILKGSVALPLAAVLPRWAFAPATFTPSPAHGATSRS